MSGSTVYAGGWFQNIGGQPRYSLAALDAATGRATPWYPLTYGTVDTLAVSGSTLYVGGYFYEIGGQPRAGLAAFDATTGNIKPWRTDLGSDNPEARTVAISGSTLYVGGHFQTTGGQSRFNIAAFDIATAKLKSWNPFVGGDVYSISTYGSTVYVGGRFTGVGPQAQSCFAEFRTPPASARDWWRILR